MGYFDYCFKVRGKCDIARQIFAQAALAPEYALNQGYPSGINDYDGIFSSLIEPREYDINNVYIAGSSRGGWAFFLTTGDILPTKGVPPVFITPYNPTLYTMQGASLLRGYLQPMTLAEFCTAQNLAQRATRTYIETFNNNNANYNAHITAILDADKRAVNEFDAYADKIVPVITWYYTNSDGNRVSNRQEISISYFFTANKSNTSRWEQVTIPLSGGREYKRIVEPYSFPTAYYAISAPYVSSLSSAYSGGEGVPLNGYIYCTKSGDNMRVTATQTDAPIYTLLSVGYSDIAATSTSDYYPITDGIFSGKYAASWKTLFTYDAKTIPVFNSIDDIIKLFDDFGVVVTTDWDEVLSPVPTPEESATPNPDPTDREIPNFPDNTTEFTPVEPAYITPSTFGQSCIYTPTTTRDFLRWVCNSTVDVGNWARLFANPADVIMGINLYNLDIVAHDSTHVEAKTETNILGVTTPIPNYAILDGYNNIVDGGTLHLQAYYGNYADFTSMTYQMFVPFVGFTTLRACDAVNKTLHLYYAVDFATGSAVAFVNSDDKLIYTSPCTVAGKIPLSTSDRNSQMINNTLSVLGGLSGLLGGVASGNVGGGVGALMGGLGGLQMQTNYSNKGSLSSVNIYKLIPAFVERTRYDLFFPSNDSAYINARYQTAAGAPSTQFDTLLNCVDAGGFVQSDVVYLTSQTATETEKQQIIDLIKSGIYL